MINHLFLEQGRVARLFLAIDKGTALIQCDIRSG